MENVCAKKKLNRFKLERRTQRQRRNGETTNKQFECEKDEVYRQSSPDKVKGWIFRFYCRRRRRRCRCRCFLMMKQKFRTFCGKLIAEDCNKIRRREKKSNIFFSVFASNFCTSQHIHDTHTWCHSTIGRRFAERQKHTALNTY